MIRTLAITLLLGLAAPPAALATPDPTARGASIEKAAPKSANDKDPALIAKAEILLDRARVSPGEIDGWDGDNFRNAIRAFQQVNGLPVSGNLDAATWDALTRDGAPVLKAYTITITDAAGPFTRAIPATLEAMARLPGLSYTSAQAELAEKFHMSPTLLRELNPRADFGRAGTELTVADVPEMLLRSARSSVEAVPPPNPPKASEEPPEVTIVVDKPARNVRVYDSDGKFLAFFPATIGSEEKPAPSGDFKVNGVSWNPNYEYDPKFAWKGVTTKRKLRIGPGPNNPVGLVWIDLTAPTYGIHGTPAPSAIGKTQSHGCIRLTNWDAVELAGMVRPGDVVRFQDQDSPVAPLVETAPVSGTQQPALSRRGP
ncbi:MAG TPA: L,D-transpeptidase [Roseiarcus sp.]|jgi:lipoprotein-anchoring transpeptidase ErfK/SrfK